MPAKKHKASKAPTAKQAHEALDRLHEAAKKSGADKLSAGELDAILRETGTKTGKASKTAPR